MRILIPIAESSYPSKLTAPRDAQESARETSSR